MLRLSILLSMTISVIIPTHKRVAQVERLIHSLRDQNFPKKNLQVLLISNLEDKRLRERARQWKREFYDFKYMETGEKGVNKARNLGIRLAGGDILYFLDDDCVLPSADHLTRFVTQHRKLTQIAGIGGSYKTIHILEGVSRFYHEQQKQWMDTASIGDSHKTSQLIGGNASYKREVFDRGFVFDSRIIFGGSEESFNRLLVSNGYDLVLLGELDVYHASQINVFSLVKKSFQQGVGYFNNQLKENKKDRKIDMKKEAAFSPTPVRSWIHYVYYLFFKLGYFWAGSAEKTKVAFLFRVLYFLLLILKSRWIVIKNQIFFGVFWKYITRFFGKAWFYIGEAYGQAVRFLGPVWFWIGALYGYVVRFLGLIWFWIGALYGYVVRFLGLIWFYIGALYGMFVRIYHRTPLAKIWYFGKYQFHKRVVSLLRKNKKFGGGGGR